METARERLRRAIAKAAELIDMARHSGKHARMGATDVCPFVPMAGATMEDCVELARCLGRRVGEELGIPVYLYGAAASRPERRRLPDIRQGEYEALPEKLKNPAFAPDFGAAEFNARSGATAIGAREFLIAWNVNLNTRDHGAGRLLRIISRSPTVSFRDLRAPSKTLARSLRQLPTLRCLRSAY